MSKKILLADDSVTIQRVVELTFSDQGYDVTCLGNAREVLGKARELHPDLVLLDVNLPEQSGYDVCRYIKQEPGLGNVPVMLLSGTFEPFDSERARSSGASGHLTKPFESQVLISRVSELLHNPRVDPTFPQPAAAAPAASPPEPAVEVEAAVKAVPTESAPQVASSPAGDLSPETLDAIARRVVERLSPDVVREVAWEVVPELAERLVLERIRQIEEEAQ